LDLAVCVAAAPLWLPVLLAVSTAIRVRLGRNVLFRQARVGLREKVFTLYKFRTMTAQTDASGALLPDEQRLTAFGSFLRRTSLDELPQLWNVITGDMALVGPRPLVPEYLTRYNWLQRRRHDVVPGITGWAQIHGRNELPWEQKFEYDLWYVENCGMLVDLKILLYTVAKVLRGEGINRQGHATAPEFRG